jgi:hypothetical protein
MGAGSRGRSERGDHVNGLTRGFDQRSAHDVEVLRPRGRFDRTERRGHLLRAGSELGYELRRQRRMEATLHLDDALEGVEEGREQPVDRVANDRRNRHRPDLNGMGAAYSR